MLELFRAIEEINPNYQNLVMTVIEGESFGEKALISNHEMIWKSQKDGFFASHKEEIEQLGCCTQFENDGQKVFCELLGREKKMVICGGGHVSIPVIRMGLMVGFLVTVLEDRPKFADNARRSGASEVFCEPFEKGLERIEGNEDTYFIIVTRGHRYDQVCLEKIARKKHAYIGMMGSKRRVRMVKEALIENGADPEVINHVYTPIGLDIGAETPEEIAVAIMAEIIEVKNKRKRDNNYTKEILREICKEESAADEVLQNGKVLVTIIDRKGSAPRKIGTKMLILPDGQCVGTIGGGCAEAEIYRKALQKIRKGDLEPERCRVDMTGAEAEDEGMVCGGVIDVLLEMI